MTKTNPVRPLCSACGSDNITRDALVCWDDEAQRWEVSNVLDDATCEDCEASGNVIEWVAAGDAS